VQPPAPVYAARPPPGSAAAAAGAAVYGLYSAVSLADPVRICRLRDQLPDLLKSRSWQEAGLAFITHLHALSRTLTHSHALSRTCTHSHALFALFDQNTNV
jgi:hypothetical protein